MSAVAGSTDDTQNESTQEKLHRYENVCKALNLDEDTRKRAWELLLQLYSPSANRLTPTSQSLSAERGFTAAALYVASKMRVTQTVQGATMQGNGISVSQLVRATDTGVTDFFKYQKEIISKLQLGSQFEEQLKTLERQFVVAHCVFKKYDQHFPTLFPQGIGEDDRRHEHSKSLPYSLGWYFFLLAKAKILGQSADLVNAWSLMTCVMHLMLAHVPQASRAGEFWDELKGDTEEPTSANSVELSAPTNMGPSEGSHGLPAKALEALCRKTKGMLDEVKLLKPKFDEFVKQLVKDKTVQVNHDLGNADIFMPGLLSQGNMNANTNTLQREYDLLRHQLGDLDESMFLHGNLNLGTPAKNTPNRNGPVYQGSPFCARNLQRDGFDSNGPSAAVPGGAVPANRMDYQPLTPLRGPNLIGMPSSPAPSPSMATPGSHLRVPQTPITGTHELVTWLKQTVMHRTDSPSEQLTTFFKACTTDQTESIVLRVSNLTSKFCFSTAPSSDDDDADERDPRADLAIKLYYKVLESILVAEQVRLRQSNFTSLLTSHEFHTALLACCIEAVVFAYNMTQKQFPVILDVFGLSAFNFNKVIESFVKHEPSLPAPIKKHMNSIETRILECMAWAEDSPLHELMEEYDETHREKPIVEEGKENEPADKVKGAGNAASPSVASKKKSAGSHALELFIRKVMYLAALRIHDLCSRLLLDQHLLQQVWVSLKEVLTNQRGLLVDRHLDQVIMCTIYGVCKVNQDSKQITFRNIIEQYKQTGTGSSKNKVFREVVMANKSDAKGDIIMFYNNVYIPAMKAFLLQFGPAANGVAEGPAASTSAGSSAQAPSTSTTAAGSASGTGGLSNLPTFHAQSPQKVSQRHNLYVSTPRTPALVTMTPRTKALYAFGESPAQELQSINKKINRDAALSAPGSTGAPPPFPAQDVAASSGGRSWSSKRLDFSRDPSPIQKRARHGSIHSSIRSSIRKRYDELQQDTSSRNSQEALPPARPPSQGANAGSSQESDDGSVGESSQSSVDKSEKV